MDFNLETCVVAFLIGVALYLLVNRVFMIEGNTNISPCNTGACAVEGQNCYYEQECDPLLEAYNGGKGCNADGKNQNCRFCEFGEYNAIKCGEVEGINVCTPNSEGRCPVIDATCPAGVPSPANKNEHGITIQGRDDKCCETYLQAEDNCNECLRSVGCGLPPPPPPPPPPPLNASIGKPVGECCTLKFPYLSNMMSDCHHGLICTSDQYRSGAEAVISEKCPDMLSGLNPIAGICAR
jgi:hypothetical protein